MKRGALLALAAAVGGVVAVSYWATGSATDTPSALALSPDCVSAVSGGPTGTLAFGGSAVRVAAETVPGTKPAELTTGVAASRDGATTVTVTDARGADRIELSTDSGTTWTRLATGHDLRYPAVSPSGDRVVWSAEGALMSAEAASSWKPAPIEPVNGGKQLAQYTRFLDDHTLLLSVEVGIAGVDDDFAALSDVWTYDLRTADWTRLTSGAADTDRWTLANTPVPASDGSVLYVRHTGLGSGTEADLRTELRRVSPAGKDVKVADLPDRWGIVDVASDGSILWNAPDPASQWQLIRTTTGAAGVDLAGGTVLGCGRASWAPPLNHDPDIR
ncbi:MAG TPA: hypothetical protein VGD67_12200 [Pseudonocardiaceae bacterium]